MDERKHSAIRNGSREALRVRQLRAGAAAMKGTKALENGQNRTRAAKILGISERTLRNKLNLPKPVPTP